MLGDRAAGAADVARLGYVRQVVEEALRLYPPGGYPVADGAGGRKDRLSAAVIRPGDTVMIPVYGLHRHRRLWEEPDAYSPRPLGGEDRDRPLPVSALR